VQGCRLGATGSACGANVRPWSLIATLNGPTPGYSSPHSLTPSRQLTATSALPVVATAPGGWLRVRLVARPNGQTTWISTASCSLTRTSFHIVIDLARHRLLLFRLGRLAVDAPTVATNSATLASTVTGHFFVALFAQPPDPSYAPFVIVTSAFANGLSDWEQDGQPVVAILGSASAGAAADPSSPPANGGIVVAADTLTRLRPVPTGTPLDIVTKLIYPRAPQRRSQRHG
jgi:hypothetical protein